MENPSSSDQIIYMSPHNHKFPSKSKPDKPFLYEQPLPPSFEGGCRDPGMTELLTPQKVQGENSAMRVLNQSSTNKPNRLPFPGDKNPFGEFEDEKDAGLLEREERVKEEDVSGNWKKGDTIKKEKRWKLVNRFLASPKKEALTPKQSQHHLERSITMQYQTMLAMIRNNEHVKYPRPFFFKSRHAKNLSKLICFDLNRKNGKRVKYDSKTKTCQPTFRCFGCWKEYNVASALGGHLSKCQKKEQHLQRVRLDESMYSLYSSEQEDYSEEDSEDISEKKSGEENEKGQYRKAKRTRLRRSSKRVQLPRPKRMAQKEKPVVNLSPSPFHYLLRPKQTRLAKTRAEMLIKEAIESHFE